MAIATATLISAAIQVVASVAMSFISKALRKKPKVDTDSLDFEQTVQRRLRNGQPLEILVGRRIAAGVGVFDDAYGSKNEYGVSVTVLCAKPCSQFHKLFVDGEPVTLSGDPTVGEVQVTSHFLGKSDARRVKVRLFLGHNNAALGDYLAAKFPGKFNASDDGGEYCVLVTECRNTNDDFDEDSGENYIPFQGYPEFKVELSGAKVCDPRNGGIYSDETTYVFSDNAALIDAQYDYGWYDGNGDGRALIVGNGYPEGLMDLPRIKANADYCDVEGFACAGIVRSGANDQEEIWKCYNADRVEHPASIYSVPEGNRVISETIDLSLFPSAHISVYDEDGYSTEVYNEIQTVYAEPEEFYGEKDLPLYSDPAWIAADNHIPRQMSLPLLFVTNKASAARLQKQEICISRTPATCTISDLPFGYIRIGVGDVITVTGSAVSALNDRQWIVKGKGQSPMGDVSLMLRAFAGAEAFDFDEGTEIPPIDINLPIPRPWPWWERMPYVNPGTVAGINTSVGNLNTDMSGIIAGTRPLAGIMIENRGQLIPEIDGIGGNVNGILNGTAELAEIRIAGRGAISPELNGINTSIGDLDGSVQGLNTDVSGIIAGTRELANVTLTGRGILSAELDTIGGDISGLNLGLGNIVDGTTALTDINVAGRGNLLSELDGVASDISGLDIVVNDSVTGISATHGEVQAIVSGSRLLGDVKLTEKGSVKSIIDTHSTNINTAISQSSGSALVITSDQSSVSGLADNGSSATTPTVTATAAGGTSPYSYSWSFVSGDNGIIINSASAATTTFSGTPGVNNSLSATYLCTVTDDLSETATVSVTVTLTDWTNTGGSGGGLHP